jgi:hypothetical protein
MTNETNETNESVVGSIVNRVASAIENSDLGLSFDDMFANGVEQFPVASSILLVDENGEQYLIAVSHLGNKGK